MIDFYLVSGFLGSGKTTFLKKILNEYSDDNRIAVIQNEFAPVGTDGKDLKRTGKKFKLIEINNGSVFCVCLLGNFIESLQNIVQEYSPDMIILEASGLSDPVNILELLQSENIRHQISLAKIITIVDAKNFKAGLKTLPRFQHQIMIADLIIINKTDLYTGNITDLYEEIRNLNPYAIIKDTKYCEIPSAAITASFNNEAAGKFFGMKSEKLSEINACVLRSHEKISRKNLEIFITEMQKKSDRIKGYVNTSDGKITAVQTVYDQVQFESIDNYVGPTELVIFGKSLEMKKLIADFKKFTD